MSLIPALVSGGGHSQNRPVTSPSFARMTPRRWIEYTLAILAGNGLYFLVLFPGLTPVLQHQPFRIDPGLAVDFGCCVAVYAMIRLGVAHAHRSTRRPPA